MPAPLHAEQCAGLDLSHWRLAFCGAEPVRPATLRQFAAKFAAGQRVVVVDSESRRELSAGMIGEIWVAGHCVADGYFNQPEATQATFQATLADSGEGPFLRTGDLGFLCDGELYITGRLKDMIVVDGRNHFPQDIEETVEGCHPSILPGGCGAFGVEISGVERVVVTAEIDRRTRRDHSRGEPSAAVPRRVSKRPTRYRAHATCAAKINVVTAGGFLRLDRQRPDRGPQTEPTRHAWSGD